ncbi:MAG: hypothetical protein M1479_08945 [Actinobacteria bacterium]|nr:hypothetical protein [Actinomycetota bacterium]
MIGETDIIIDGFNCEMVDGKRIAQSVFLLDTEKSNCMEVPVLDDNDIDKEKLVKELQENYRKEVVVFIEIKNDYKRPNTNYVIVKFIGIKNK